MINSKASHTSAAATEAILKKEVEEPIEPLLLTESLVQDFVVQQLEHKISNESVYSASRTYLKKGITKTNNTNRFIRVLQC